MSRNICSNSDTDSCINYNYPQQIRTIGLHNEDIEEGKNSSLQKLRKSDPKLWKRRNRQHKKKRNQKHNIESDESIKITEHLMEIEEVCNKLQTNSETGLSEKEAEFRLKRDGLNAFTPPKQTYWLILYLKEMTGGFALLLWFSSIASIVAYVIEKERQDYYLAIVLALTVILTGTFSYYQQASSSNVVKSFKNMIPPQTFVIREGKKRLINSNQIVIGDLVYCKSGDRIPADIRVIKSESMKVDNSSLTGESDPLSRNSDVGHESPIEARNLAFFSTNCVDGSGYGIAIATGDNTVMGDIARLVSNIKNEKTPIAKEIDRFVKIITVISVVTGLTFLGIELGFGDNFFDAFILMIGITVGNVPEGLLPALTVALTLTAKRMASKNCLIKNLEAVETLGSTSTICTDKTGTLTQNRMTVEHCWLGTKVYRISHNKQELQQQINSTKRCWESYSRCAILCSRSEFIDENTDIMKRMCSGDASETAILRFMESVEGPVVQYRAMYPKIAEKPFSSTYKYQYSIHKNCNINSCADNGSMANIILVMKGAPERIIKLCSTVITDDGQSIKIDEDFIEQYEEIYRELGSMGERVLALCDYEFTQFPSNYKFNLEDGNDFELGNFRFLGLIAMIDPPRPTVPDAVAKCRSAGIKIIMVTGDHPITAQAIAKSVGIFSESHRNSISITVPTIDEVIRENRSIVVPGDELSELTDEELRGILDGYEEIVFARTSPQQKLRIVENCQFLGQIVAVTGDGVNDSPALKKADIGIAMGITGSEVSKQAADMILLDDNFATIVIGIEEGRRIFDNMKKTISYILAGNVTTLYPFIAYILFGFPLAMGTITVLLVALGTDMVPAVSLAYERAESDIMNLPPRNPRTDKLVNFQLLMRAYCQIGVIETMAGFYAYFIALNYEGFKPKMLWQLRGEWNSKNATVYKYGPNDDWNGEPNTPTNYEERQQIQIIAQSSYFIAIVVVQWIDVIVCKTRRLSNFQQGMNNWILNGSILFETALAIFFCYTPHLNTVLRTAPVMGQIWISAIPFFFYIFIFEEIRKFIVRNYSNSFYGKELLA